MSLRTILHYPDPRLRRQASPVPAVTDEVRRLVDDMAETMYDAPGIGLAAIQVNEPWRVIVIDISQTRDQLQVFINPEILAREGEQELEEGCLSVPGIYEPVTRAHSIRVRALNRDGQTVRNRGRRPARHLHPARNRSSRRQGLRRLPLAPETIAHSQEIGKAATVGDVIHRIYKIAQD